MWECSKCNKRIEESFEVCWNCGTSKDGQEDPKFQPEGMPEDRAGPPRQAASAGISRPRFCLLLGAIYGFFSAFMPRPPEFQQDQIGEIFGTLPLWAWPCLAVLAMLCFAGVVLMGAFIRQITVDRAPVARWFMISTRVDLLKSGPSWFKKLLNFNWPVHWWANVFWAMVGGGAGILISAPFFGMWDLFRGVYVLIAAAGLLLGFRLAARPLDEVDGQ